MCEISLYKLMCTHIAVNKRVVLKRHAIEFSVGKEKDGQSPSLFIIELCSNDSHDYVSVIRKVKD